MKHTLIGIAATLAVAAALVWMHWLATMTPALSPNVPGSGCPVWRSSKSCACGPNCRCECCPCCPK